jgi:hypothetical protein
MERYGVEKFSSSALCERLDDPNQLVASIALAAGEIDEFPRLDDHRSPVCRPRDRHAAPPTEVEQAFVPQKAQGSKHGVRIHAEDCGEVTRRR